jgi:predicted Zn-dependent protease
MRRGLGRIGRFALGAVVGAAALFLIGRARLAPASSPRPGATLPPAAHVWCRQAEEEVRAGQYDAALRDAEQDLRQTPDCPRAHLLAGLLYERRSNSKPALEHLARAAQAYPNDPRVQTAYGRVLALTGDHVHAAEILRGVTQHGDTRAEPFRWLGYAYMHLPQNPENIRRAEENLRQAVAREPGYAEANYDLALLLFRQGQAKQALPFAQTAVEHRKHYPRGLYLLARIQRDLGNPAEAARIQTEFQHENKLVERQEALSARLSSNPADIEAALEMAQTMRELDKPAEALRYLQRAAARAPDDTRVQAAIAQVEQFAAPHPGGTGDVLPVAGTP